jgi:predicted nucleotidyltransferase
MRTAPQSHIAIATSRHGLIMKTLVGLVAKIVALTHDVVRPSRVYLFGSRARGRFDSSSDADLLLLVEPDVRQPWWPRDNVLLQHHIRSALTGSTIPVDIYVRSIDQFADAHSVPVCPENAAYVEGSVVWTAPFVRHAIRQRPAARVRFDNAVEWLQIASASMRVAVDGIGSHAGSMGSATALHGDAPVPMRSGSAPPEVRALRAAAVAISLARNRPIPYHKLPIESLIALLAPDLAGDRTLVLATASHAPLRSIAVAAIHAAEQAVREMPRTELSALMAIQGAHQSHDTVRREPRCPTG